MDENITREEELQLSTVPLLMGLIRKELEDGNLVAIRAKNDFFYVYEDGDNYNMYIHTAGQKEASGRRAEKDEKSRGLINNMMQMAEAAYAAQYPKEMNIYGVMAAMEEGILKRYPVVENSNDNKRANKSLGRRKPPKAAN